jgi:hypothetical protein
MSKATVKPSSRLESIGAALKEAFPADPLAVVRASS